MATRTGTHGTSNRSHATTNGKDAISLLMADHKKVKQLFRKFAKAHEGEDIELCKEIVETACNELEMHTTLEEEIFYPAARETVKDESLLDEAAVEHESAKSLIEQLKSLDPDDPKWAACFIVLGEYVNHHIKEEENELFPQSKRGGLDVDALGEQMLQRKEELQELLTPSEDEDAEDKDEVENEE